jgi:hypothetical protein
VIVAHVMGLPIEESVAQLVPAGAAIVAAATIAGRTARGRLRRWTGRQGNETRAGGAATKEGGKE